MVSSRYLWSVPEVKKVSMGERRGSHVRQFLPLSGISDTARQEIAAKGFHLAKIYSVTPAEPDEPRRI